MAGEEEGKETNAFSGERSASTDAAKKKCKRKPERTKYECPICQVYFTRQGELKRHMVKHSDVRPYKCTICERAFKRSFELSSHMQIHRNVTYACKTCSFTTTNKVSLRTHNRRVHQRDLRYRCEQCSKGFMSNYDLEDHKASHLDTKSFICEYCGLTFSQKTYLIAHKRAIHEKRKTAPKQHQCDLCDKNFVSEHILRKHVSLHSQRFLCAQCGKEFATNHALKLHSRKHTGERPYQCKQCTKAFARSMALRVHELTHTGERPYVCDLCEQHFTQRSSMMVHRRRHPGNHPPPPPLLLSRLQFCAPKSS
ncbi:PR domain zinc finger protein 5-like isoform X2 [Linepithema humile]|uniref:PR domain zinc finger protein 5-like isoform X2 n=1 Tax=Linepithema humile TaxID=83485 RepID=UPI00351EBD76